MKKIFNKHNVINFICLLVIIGAVFFGFRASNGKPVISNGGGNSASQLPADFPTLRTMSEMPSGWNGYYRDNNNIHVALVVNSRSEEDLTADILAIFSWGRSQFGQIGPDDYVTENWGTVSIALVKMENMDQSGKIQVPRVVYHFWLDQDRIDYLLGKENINTLDGIDAFFTEIAEAYQGRAGRAITLTKNNIYFYSWRLLLNDLRSLGAVVP